MGENAKNDFQSGFRICPTVGEILPDGRAIELVTGGSPDTLALLYFGGKQCLIAPQIQVGLTTYVAPVLDSSVLRATRFPSGAAEYGGTETLFWKVAGLFHRGMSKKGRSFWRATNHRSVFVPAGRGTVSNLACSKVIFSETGDDSRENWGRESMYLRLSPDTNEPPPLTALEEDLLAAEFQPQFLMYRLHHLHWVHQSVSISGLPRLPGFELGRSLLACVQAEPKIVKAVAPLLQAHEQALRERRLLDPAVAIVEAFWSPLHNEKEFPVKELATRVTALLRSRGEISTYNEKQLGWKLRNMGLARHNNGKCKVLRIDREMRRRIHQLAIQFGLELPKVPNCADCKDPQLIVHK